MDEHGPLEDDFPLRTRGELHFSKSLSRRAPPAAPVQRVQTPDCGASGSCGFQKVHSLEQLRVVFSPK